MDALTVAQQALAVARERAASAPWTVFALNSLAAIYQQLARWTDAECCYDDMTALIEANDGGDPDRS